MIWMVVMAALLPMPLMLAMLYGTKRYLDREARRDPLTTELRRFPGESGERQREALVDTAQSDLFAAVFAGPTFAVAILVLHLQKDFQWRFLDSLLLITGVGVTCYLSWSASRRMRKLRQMRQGIQAEKAVAQELADALSGNNRIIHDVQAGEFNIDHVVITPAGVFAVETKSRLKPPVGQGAKGVKVFYDGQKLAFPGWTETKPLDQARRQADWLEKHLRKETADEVAVQPVLALPGWFVENTAPIKKGMVRVINPKNSEWLFTKSSPVFDDAVLKRTRNAVEKLAGIKDD